MLNSQAVGEGLLPFSLSVSAPKMRPIMAPPLLHHLEPPHRSSSRRELLSLQTHPLQHGEEQVGQRVIVFRVESEMLAVLEPSPGEQRRQICRYMRIGVSEIGSIEHHCPVEKCFTILPHALEFREKVRQQFHVPLIDRFELVEFRLRFAMVREVVIAIRYLHFLDLYRR